MLRSRLFQFVVVGTALWLVTPRRAPSEIVVPTDQIEAMVRAEARRRGVASLTPAERSELIARLVEDELLYREGVRLGFDRDDSVVRARVIQKVLFYAEDAAGAAAPITDAEVEAAWAREPGRYRAPATLDYEHVFVTGSGEPALERARALLVALRAGGEPSQLGDAFGLPRRSVGATSKEIADKLGEEIAAATAVLPLGAWSEPLVCQYGLHLVRVSKRIGGAPLPLSACAKEVRATLVAERKAHALRAILDRLRRDVVVRVQGVSGPVPSSSAERVVMQGLD